MVHLQVPVGLDHSFGSFKTIPCRRLLSLLKYPASQAYTGILCILIIRKSLLFCQFILSIVKPKGGQLFKGFMIQTNNLDHWALSHLCHLELRHYLALEWQLILIINFNTNVLLIYVNVYPFLYKCSYHLCKRLFFPL